MPALLTLHPDRPAPAQPLGTPAQPPVDSAPRTALLAPLRATIETRLRGQGYRLDLRFVGEPLAATTDADVLEPRLAVRLSARQAHLAWFPVAALAGAGPCPECLDRRMRGMRTIEEQWALQRGSRLEGHALPFLLAPLRRTIACLCAALPVAPGPTTQVATLDLLTQEVRIDELLPDAFCTSCRPTEEAAPIALRDTLPARSGKSRMRALLEHRLPTRALVNPVCGTAASQAIPGYVQSLTAPVFGQYLQRAVDAPPREVGWSGLCLRADESRVAGLLEALERQAGMRSPPAATVVVGSYRSLAGQAIDPTLCFAYNDESYERDLGLTRYDADQSLEWTWGHSLMTRRPVLIPRQLVYYDRLDRRQARKFVDNNSSGCALGACFEEAVLKGLLELFERDSFVIAWHRRLSLPRLDPRSCGEGCGGGCGSRKVAALLHRIDYLGFDVSLLDGRLDMRVPTVIAVARRRDGGIGSMTVGAAASLDPVEAMQSALLECATSIVEMPAMFHAREARIRALAEDHHRVESVMDHSLLYALPHMAQQLDWLDASPERRSFDTAFAADRAWHSQGDIGADLGKLLAELRRCGLHDAVAVDLTTPEQRRLDLKTVRVVVPGLAPIDFGHPRNRAEKLPRFETAAAAFGLESTGPHVPNRLPHPFP